MPNFKEWTNVEIPPFAVGNGWEDRSWHNDACAKAEKSLRNPKSLSVDSDYPRLRLWVEADDVVEREYEDSPKFLLEYLEDDVDDWDGDGLQLYGGESAELCARAVAKAVARSESGQPPVEGTYA